MRTLNRPMFNMGGPIKEGVMHGIREPYRGGQLVRPGPGRQGYQGAVGTGINVAKWLATLGSRAGKTFQGVGRGYNLGPIGSVPKNYPVMIRPKPSWGARIAEKWKATPSWFRSSVERDPVVGAGLWAKRALTSPTAKGIGQKVLRGVATPTGVIGGGLAIKAFWPDGTPKTEAELAAEGQHGPFDHTDKKKIDKAQAAFAEASRDTRVKKYLDMMGYDRSKKTAVADALIDASKIVSERGSLKGDVTRELINPIIQATSKRFDKPEQIREAVGLMSVKAAIEKDLEDPSIKALRLEQLKALKGGFSKDIGDFILSAKGTKVKPKALEQYARAKANEHGLDFTVVTDEMMAKAAPEGATEAQIIQSVVGDDGIYMVGDAIIQVTGGVPKQIA